MLFFLGDTPVIKFVTIEQCEALIDQYNKTEKDHSTYTTKFDRAKLIIQGARKHLSLDARRGMKLAVRK